MQPCFCVCVCEYLLIIPAGQENSMWLPSPSRIEIGTENKSFRYWPNTKVIIYI